MRGGGKGGGRKRGKGGRERRREERREGRAGEEEEKEEGGKEGREGDRRRKRRNSQILVKTSMICGHSPCGSEDGEDKLMFVEGVKVLSPKDSWAGRGANTNQQVWGRVRGT